MRKLLSLELSYAVCSCLLLQFTHGDNHAVDGGRCEDKQPWCESMKKYCSVDGMAPICPKTCEVCQKPTDQSSPNDQEELFSDCKQKRCDHNCEEEDMGEPKCSCKRGYELQKDGTTCRDIDECEVGNPCNSTDLKCINTDGSFKCENVCRKGEMKYYGRETCCALSNEQCGRNSENSEVSSKLDDNGDVIVTRWPWVSLIYVKSTNKNCAGVLVDRLWLIAAAHCFKNAETRDVSVFLGVRNSDEKSGFKNFSQRRKVEKIFIHPNFNHPENDIAMVKLTQAVGVTNFVRPACLPQNELPPRGQRCWAIGYAAIPHAGRVTRWMQQEAVEMSDRKSCASSNVTLGGKMICIRHGDRTSPQDCQGSTGGPLICQRCSSCGWFVAGMATEGISCAVDKTLSAFTSTSLHESWIRETMGLERLHARIGASCQIPGKSTQKIVEWTEWGPWGDCSLSCEGGSAVRSRSCKNGNPGDNGCIGESVETKMCKTNPCAGWQNWSDWSACSSSCKGGTRFRSRKCVRSNAASGGCKGTSRQVEKCNSQPCPKWGRWSNWSQCSVTCGKGKRIAERSCVGGEIGDRGCVGRTTRSKSCRRPSCPKWSKWTGWSRCSQTCGTGIRTSTRKCRVGKKVVDRCTGDSIKTESCTERQCRVCSSWMTWSECSATCGVGQQRRHRECSDKKSNSELNEMRFCNTEQCPSSWSKWSDWTKCSVTCGGGVTTRRRQCRGGHREDCHGVSIMEEPCNQDECPPTWTEWGAWGKCDAKCGSGIRRRERNCKGGSCRGKPFQEDLCFVDVDCEEIVCSETVDNVDLCELSAAWCTIQPQLLFGRCDKTCCIEEYRIAFTEWSSWSSCTKSCGRGIQTRRRACSYPDSCAKFNGKLEEARLCNTMTCKARTVSVGGCSASCGGGFLHQPCVDEDCEGDKNALVLVPCNTHKCPDPVSEWGEWGPCSSTCGVGMRERKRVCLLDHEKCKLDLVASEECTISDCVGKWSGWSEWGPCSSSCGLGKILRRRSCLEGVCDGPNSQEELCLTFDCPTVTSGCQDDISMIYLCPLLTQYCGNDYMKFACRKACGHC